MSEHQQNKPATFSQESKKELVDLLEFEISRLENEQQRPGWTKWALAGATASCIWFLLDQFESHPNQIKITTALFLFLVWNLIWDALNRFKMSLSSAPPANRKAGFWFTNMILAETRLVLSAKLFEKSCLLVIIWMCPLIPRNWIYYLAFFVYGSSLITILIGIAASYGKFPIANTRPKHPGSIQLIYYLGIIPAAVLLIKLIQILIENFSQLAVAEIRVSLLLFALTIITPLFLTDKIHHPFLAALLELRRKLALSEIECESAIRQLNILFEGMNAAEVLRENVDTVLGKFRIAVAASEMLAKEAKALSSSDNYSLNQEQQLELKPLFLQIKPRLESVEKLLTEADEAKAGLKGRIAVLGWLAPPVEPEMQKLFETVEIATTETKKTVQAKIEEIKKLLTQIE